MPASPSSTRTFDVAIVGAGIAGAAALFHLSRAGLRCVLLEREFLAGMHATGRNAAMIRQNVVDPVERWLARRSAAFYAHPAGFDEPPEFRRTGSLLLFADRAPEHACDPELDPSATPRAAWSRSEAVRRVPLLESTPFAVAEHCAEDGVLDVAALVQGYLRAAISLGASVHFRARVTQVACGSAGGFEIETEVGAFRAERCVDAAGAWCGEIAARLGSPVRDALTPHRRHLFVTGPLRWVDPSWPFVWDEGNEFYFRPESSGLLFCPCDEARVCADEASVDPAVEEAAAEKIARCVPRLLDAPFRFRWAGLRTFTRDGRAIVGADPEIAGLYWCGGLGGHGISTAHEVGRLLSLAILGSAEGNDMAVIARLSPRRCCAVVSPPGRV